VDSSGCKILDNPYLFVDVPEEFRTNHSSYGAVNSDTYDIRKVFKRRCYMNGSTYYVDAESNDFLALNNVDVTTLTDGCAYPAYLVVKLNDTSIGIKLNSTNPSLSSDLSYISIQKPVYKIRCRYTEYDYTYDFDYVFTEDSYSYIHFDDEYLDDYYLSMIKRSGMDTREKLKANSEKYYYRVISQFEMNHAYDFFFAESAGGREKILPGDYKVSLLDEDENVKTSFIKSFTKAEEKAGNTYGQLIELPYININGKIVDTLGRVVHRDGTIVRLTNNSTGKTYEFKYKCAFPLEEGLIGVGAQASYAELETIPSNANEDLTLFSEDAQTNLTLKFSRDKDGNIRRRYYWNNAWDEHFRFMYNGIDCKNLLYVTNAEYLVHGYRNTWHEAQNPTQPSIVHNCDSLRSSPAVPEGDYKLELLSYDGNLISTYFSHLEVSKAKQSQLYDLTLELPFCNVSGVVRTTNGDVCYGNDWAIKMKNLNEPEKSGEMKLWSRDPASNNMVSRFAFYNLGVNRDCIGGSQIHTLGGAGYITSTTDKLGVTTSGYLAGYAEPGLWPGEYELTIEYKGREMYVHPETIHVSKENERAGLLSFDIVVQDVYTNLVGRIVNVEFPDSDGSLIGNIFTINEEDYDEDITNDFQDRSREKYSIDIFNSISYFNIPSIGRYAVHLSATYADGIESMYYQYREWHQMYEEIPISNVKDSSGRSIFSVSGTLHPTENVVNVQSASKIGRDTRITVYVPYWYTYWGKAFLYTDEHTIEDKSDPIIPWFSTDVYVENLSLGESWTSSNSILTKKPISGASFDMNGEEWSSGSTYISASELRSKPPRWRVKTGNYRVTLKRSADSHELFSEDYAVSGCNYSTNDNGYSGIVSGSLGLNTLNIAMLYKRLDTGKYQNIAMYGDLFNFTVTYIDGNGEKKLWYDRKDGSYAIGDLSQTMLKNYSKIDKSYERVLNVPYRLSSSSDETVLCSVIVNASMPMYALKMLPSTGLVSLDIRFDSGSTEDFAEVEGLYKIDLNRSFTDDWNTSKPIVDYQYSDWWVTHPDGTVDSKLIEYTKSNDKVSIKSLVENYVVPALSSQYEPSALIESLTSGIPSTKQYLKDGLWINEVSGTYKTGFTNYINRDLRTISNGLIDIYDTISHYTGSMTDLTTNYVRSDGKINMGDLALKNPNDFPIRYYSLVLKNLRLNFKALIYLGEYDDDTESFKSTYWYRPSARGFTFKLRIFKDGNEVQTLYSSDDYDGGDEFTMSYFDIIGLLDGVYTFKVYFLGEEVHSEERYVWNGRNIELKIKDFFIPSVVSGAITWNGATPINDVHVKVENIDKNTIYYGDMMNHVSSLGRYSEAGTRKFMYFQNSYDTEFSPAHGMMKSYPTNEAGYTSPFGPGRPCYEPKTYGYYYGKSHTYGEYQLLDMIPGRYKISYFVMPDLNDDSDWKMCGDSYYHFDIYDNSLSGINEYKPSDIRYEDIENIIDSSHTFSIPVSSLQWQNGEKVLRDEYAAYSDWTVMEVLVCFNLKYRKVSSTYKTPVEDGYSTTKKFYDGSKSEIEKLHKRAMRFTAQKSGDYFSITLLNDFTWFGRDCSTLTEFNFHSIRVLFGEKVGEQTVTVYDSTTTVPTIDIQRMYAKRVDVEGTGYSNSTLNSYREVKLLTDGQELSKTSKSANGMSGKLGTSYYGVEAGQQYSSEFNLNLGNSVKRLGSAVFLVDSTIKSVSVGAYQMKSLTITVKDRATLKNGLPGYLHRTLAGWAFLDSYTLSAYSKSEDRTRYDYNENQYSWASGFGILYFDGLLNESYSFGLYLKNFITNSYNYDNDVNSSATADGFEYKYYKFTTTSLTNGVLNNYVPSSSSSLTLEIPYQHLKISLKGYNVKSKASETPTATILMTRSQHQIDSTDTGDETFEIGWNRMNAVRSGYYGAITYVTTDEASNALTISYQPMVIDCDKTFTIYSNVAISMNVTIILKENDEVLPNSYIYFFDEDKNIFQTAMTDENGEYKLNALYIPFYLKCKSIENDFTSSTTIFSENSTYEFDASSNTLTKL